MIVTLISEDQKYSGDLNKGKSISIPLHADGVSCFYAPKVKIQPVVTDHFIGEIKQGASVNFFDVTFNPHGNGTHTECLGHINEEHQFLPDYLHQHHFIAQLVTVNPIEKRDDFIIEASSIPSKFNPGVKALIIRTSPNTKEKLTMDYSGKNPPYLSQEAMLKIVDSGIEHLLIDLPSVDREEDGGNLYSHKTFWSEGRENCTITELIYVPDEIKDGLFLLNLQVTSLQLDASPSNPIIYPILENEKSI